MTNVMWVNSLIWSYIPLLMIWFTVVKQILF